MVEVRACFTALTSSALESSRFTDAAGHCLGTQEELVVLKPASGLLSGCSRAHSTLQRENAPADQCPHRLIQELNLFLGRFSCSVGDKIITFTSSLFQWWKIKPTAK